MSSQLTIESVQSHVCNNKYCLQILMLETDVEGIQSRVDILCTEWNVILESDDNKFKVYIRINLKMVARFTMFILII